MKMQKGKVYQLHVAFSPQLSNVLQFQELAKVGIRRKHLVVLQNKRQAVFIAKPDVDVDVTIGETYASIGGSRATIKGVVVNTLPLKAPLLSHSLP